MTSPFAVAQAVAAAIAAAAVSFDGAPVTATAAPRQRWGVRDLATLRVAVVPRSRTRTSLTRGADQAVFEVDVGVGMRCDPDDAAAVAALSDLVSAIEAALDRRPLPGLPQVKWRGSQVEPIYDAELLDQARVFLSILTVTFAELP